MQSQSGRYSKDLRSGMAQSVYFYPSFLSIGSPRNYTIGSTDFLAHRRIKYVVDVECSDFKLANSGVPQGCLLLLTMFFQHINNTLRSFISTCRCSIYLPQRDLLGSHVNVCHKLRNNFPQLRSLID